MADVDPQRLEAAGTRFVAFFNELGNTFVEREELLAQIALGLLSREHVLMTGPPGTAKSGIASAVLRRVVDERTGQPSLFARQFTESTVQTDLVGPINFKTLMETGRTEHFTDEGMLGAVHAFLDEVFDGRDMLLRSTLNVLQERELKQGTKTTRGAIECALMTTNRYLAEVLESSRETLLAFVDRVAFVSFVPKGFATAGNLSNVLRRQVGGTGMSRLSESLTIQDLDALQAATESVYVSDAICDALASLLTMLDEELGAAERSDPQFLATRYLSTRTAVRSGRILRAVCVYDKLFFNPGRTLEVEQGDLKALRLSILLGGPLADSLGTLMKRETDARERRQLSIIRTERELFDRCISKLPAPKSTKKRPPASKRGSAQPKPIEPVDKLSVEKLVEIAQTQGASGVRLEEVRVAVEELASRAMREGLRASSGFHESVGASVASLVTIADAIEKAPGETLSVARWTRGRALLLLDEAVSLVENGGALAKRLQSDATMEDAAKVADERAEHLEKLVAHRKQIRALGAVETDPAHSDDLWRKAAARAEDEVCAILDVGFRHDAAASLAGAEAEGGHDLGFVLGHLTEPLAVLDRIGKRLAALSAPGAVKTRVVGPRILPLVRASFDRTPLPDRQKLTAQVDAVLEVLDVHQLRGAIGPGDWLAQTARILVRAAKEAGLPAEEAFDRAHYRKLRQIGQRVPGAYTLLEIAMRVAPKRTLHSTANPEAAASALHEIAGNLPPDLAAEVASLDMARLDATVTFLEGWYLDGSAAGGTSRTPNDGSAVDKLVASGFFGVAFDEQALLRTALEARVVSDVFPSHAPDVAKLRQRLEALRDRAHQGLEGHIQQRADSAWAAVLG
jgi:MoxR-like ATPase